MSDWDVGRVSPASESVDEKECPKCSRSWAKRSVPNVRGGERRGKMRKKARRIEEILEIPVELSTNTPKITITGFERMLIENYRGILEYQDYFVRVNTYIGILNINGFDLKLEEMTSDDLLVTGKIDSVDFENISD